MKADDERQIASRKVGAILWICCLQYFVAEAIAIPGWRPHYSLSRNFISDLGAVTCGERCSRLHAVMNASFLLQGVLIVVGAILASSMFPKGRLWTLALALVGGSGVGVFIVGLAPEDVHGGLHYLGAAENLLACNLGMAVMGVAMLSSRQTTTWLGATTLAAGLTGVGAVALLPTHHYFGLGVGGMERVAAYPFPLWLAGLGSLLLRTGRLPAARIGVASASERTRK
jgi:hypothetical membrane protein